MANQARRTGAGRLDGYRAADIVIGAKEHVEQSTSPQARVQEVHFHIDQARGEIALRLAK
jgi:hypothetical protein